jgi:hypothetical protein
MPVGSQLFLDALRYLFYLALFGVPFFFGVALGGRWNEPWTVLRRSIVLASLTVPLVVGNLVVSDLGGAVYQRYSYWLWLAEVVVGFDFLVAFGHASGNVISRGNVVSQWRATGRQIRRSLVVYGVASFAIVGLWSVPGSVSTHGDAVMIAHFRRHEAEFNELREMFARDADVGSLCEGYAVSRFPLPAERIAEYKPLLRAADIRHGLTHEVRGQTLFRYWSKPATGFTDQSIEKGYATLRELPDRLVESLDPPSRLGEGLTYRHIDDGWYLYYYNRDSSGSPCRLGA